MALEWTVGPTAIGQGSARTVMGVVTLTGVTSGSVATPVGYIANAQITPKSVDTTLIPRYGFNVLSGATTGTEAYGFLRVWTGTAGDDFAVVLYGDR